MTDAPNDSATRKSGTVWVSCTFGPMPRGSQAAWIRRSITVLACALLLSACNQFGPFAATRPAAQPRALSGPAPASSAVVVIGYPEATWVRTYYSRHGRYTRTRAVREWVDIVNENGAVLARLRPGTWTSFEQPPGEQRLYLVPASAAWNGLSPQRMAFLDVRLRRGRYYYVRVQAETPRCTNNITFGPAIDLRSAWLSNGVGSLDSHFRAILLPSNRVAPPPRGLVHPDMAGIRQAARVRSRSGCLAPAPMTLGDTSSTLQPLRGGHASGH